MTSTQQQKNKDEAEIRALIDAWSRAIERKDPQAIVEAYTPETVLFDAIPPAKTIGKTAIADLWEQCLPHFPETFRSEHDNLTVEVSGDLAFVHGMHHFIPEPADHPASMTWMRVTACFKRLDGAWRIVHEHVSVPFNPMSGQAVMLKSATDTGGSMFSEPTPEEAAATAIRGVTPHIVCRGAKDAIEFYKTAFGAKELMRVEGESGKLMHGCVEINGAAVMLVDEYPDMGSLAPPSLGGTPVTMHLTVDDVDAAFERATAAGAKVVMPVDDMFWGDRYGVVEDPFGHAWSIATPKKTLSAEEIKTAARNLQASCGPGAAAGSGAAEAARSR